MDTNDDAPDVVHYRVHRRSVVGGWGEPVYEGQAHGHEEALDDSLAENFEPGAYITVAGAPYHTMREWRVTVEKETIA